MKILFFLGHPAHYHLFKGVRQNLLNQGYEVEFAIKSKDILEKLLREDAVDYTNLLPEGRKDGYAGVALGFLKRTKRLAWFLRRKRFDLLVGSDPSIAQLGRLFRIPSIVTVEDDACVIPYFAWTAFPFANAIVAPVSCNLGRWEKRKIGYQGFQKLAYLHPNQFSPDRRHVPFPQDGRGYFLLRLSSLAAHHDFGVRGIDKELLRRLVALLEQRGQVFISSERVLDPEFEKYRISVPVKHIHHVLSYANLLIGDSQSMAVEAAMLGTPSIRFSDFAGRIGVLEELEHVYGLTFGIQGSEPGELLHKVEEILAIPDFQKVFAQRAERMLRQKLDVTAFLTWLIREYPQSVETMRRNPDYQFQFRSRGVLDERLADPKESGRRSEEVRR